MRELHAMDFVLLLLVMLLRQEVAAIKLLDIKVPAYVFKGSNDTILECSYDLESERLYAISWYKDNDEFYKYIEDRGSARATKKVTGVTIDITKRRRKMFRMSIGQHRIIWKFDKSKKDKVTLKKVDLNTSGHYKCEISGEAPNFSLVTGEANMEVIARSEEKPTIVGEEKIYASGDILALNCTSGKSYPAARLKWFVNDQQVKPDSEMVFEQHGLYSTISSLLLVLEPGHLAGDKINVRCEATVRSSRSDIPEPFFETHKTEVFVQGHASFATPSLCLLAAAVLQRLLLSM